jgi:tetratricopeptide (TPR) repeat protein
MRKRYQRSQTSGGSKAFASGARAVTQTESEPAIEGERAVSSRAPGKWRSLYVLAPVSLALLTSLNTLWNDFASDDLQMVLNNSLIKDLANLPHAFAVSGWAFSSNDIRFALDTFYRPLLNVLFTMNYALFGTTPWGWHLVNTLIHAIVTALSFLVLSELTGRKRLALIAATLFAVNPVHAESIAWVSGITDPLMTMFLLSAFYFYIKYRRGGHRYTIALALALCLFALLSKETAAAMVLIVAYCEVAYFEGPMDLRKRLLLATKATALVMVPYAVYFLLRSLALGTPTLSGEAMNPLGYALRTIPLAVVKYIGLLLVPVGYSFQHYTSLVDSLTSVQFIVPFLGLAAIIVGVLMSRSRVLAFAVAWFAIWLAPTLAVLRQYEPESLVQERYLYLPSIGFCLSIALGIEWLVGRKRFGVFSTRAAAALAVSLVVLWSAVSVRQHRVWRNTITLYQNCVAVDPDSPAARSALAVAYSDSGRFREANEQANAAERLNPRFLGAYLSLSYIAKRLGRIDEAIGYLETAISTVDETPLTRTKLATVYLNLGTLYGDQKRFDVAEQKLLRSIELWQRPVGWYYTGLNYFYQEQYEQALAMYEEVIRHVPPKYAPIHLSIGATYERLGRLDEARAEFEKYLELAPPDAPDKKTVRDRLKDMQRDSPAGKPKGSSGPGR